MKVINYSNTERFVIKLDGEKIIIQFQTYRKWFMPFWIKRLTWWDWANHGKSLAIEVYPMNNDPESYRPNPVVIDYMFGGRFVKLEIWYGEFNLPKRLDDLYSEYISTKNKYQERIDNAKRQVEQLA